MTNVKIEPIIREKLWELTQEGKRVAVVTKQLDNLFRCDMLDTMGGTFLRVIGMSLEDAFNTALEDIQGED